MFNTNYDTDSNFQILFWSIGAYGLIDVIVFRLGQALKVYESLVRPARADTTLVHELDEVVGMGKIIDVIALLLQSLIGLVVFVCMRWHLAIGARVMVPVLGRDSMAERFLDIVPALYVAYFFLCNSAKTCVLLAMAPSESRRHSALVYYDWVVNHVAAHIQGVLFVLLNVFVLLVALYTTLDMRDGDYTRPFPLIVDADVKAAVNHLVYQHRGGWTDI